MAGLTRHKRHKRHIRVRCADTNDTRPFKGRVGCVAPSRIRRSWVA